jgi:lysophospholipase L1-like esterase
LRRRSVLTAVALAPAASLLVAAPAHAASSPLRILCVGDAATVGYGDSSGLGYRRELGRLLTQMGVAHEFVVRGTNWATAAAWLDWIAGEVSAVQPDLVLLLIGTNDANPANGSLASFEANYRRVLDLTFAAKPGVKVCTAWIQHTATAWDANTQAVSNAITRQTWPTPAGWNGPMRPGVVGIANMGALPTAYLSDRVYPNKDGYDAMGWQWFRALISYLGLPTA